MHRRQVWVSLLGFLLTLSATASVQASTFQLDGLDGSCCENATVELPQFPATTQRSKYVCWNNCEAQLSGTILVEFRPVPVACGIFLNQVTVTNLAGGFTAWTGRLVMTYSRTWAESSAPPAEPNLQVWRFILNGDLTPSSGLVAGFGSNPCVVAPCVDSYGSFHVQGYIDYVRDCTTGEFSIAYAFDHDCDALEHDDVFSCRPGSFHPSRSYTWVGPEQGFVCDPTLRTAEGETTCEGFRNYDFSQPLNMICQTEQPMESGSVGNASDMCLCPGQFPGPNQYKFQNFSASTICGSSAQSDFVPPLPALAGKSIGAWTLSTIYPGPETLHIERGHMTYRDGCESNFPTRPYFIGVQTQGGFPTHKIVPPTVGGGAPVLVPASDRMIDLGDATLPGRGNSPVIGKRSVSDKMIYLNLEDG